jgi:signal transduction histidine kinase
MSRRLVLSYVSLALFVLLVLELPLAVSYARNERHDLAAKVERDAVALGTLAEDELEHPGTADRARLAAVAESYERDTGGRVVVVDGAGTAVVDTSPPLPGQRSFASRPEFARSLAGSMATGVRHSDTLGVNLLYVAVPVESGGVVYGAVRITYPTSAIDARVHRYWLMLAGIAAVVLAAASLAALRFARMTVRPLATLERASAAAGEGDLEVRAPLEGPPEIRSLARSFNEMIARLEELVRSQEAFVADASHELRSPLAALRLRLENLESEVSAAGGADLEAASREANRLVRVVDALLALARADAGTSAPAHIDLGAVIAERVSLWSALCEERGVALVSQVPNTVTANATPGRIETVLDNLLANALEASPPSGTIFVSAERRGQWAEVRVADEGPGMSPEDLARAFDRFWRARTDSEGSGLGLAIVRRLVRADGGEVELRGGPTGGVEAVVRLPLAPYRRLSTPLSLMTRANSLDTEATRP